MMLIGGVSLSYCRRKFAVFTPVLVLNAFGRSKSKHCCQYLPIGPSIQQTRTVSIPSKLPNVWIPSAGRPQLRATIRPQVLRSCKRDHPPFVSHGTVEVIHHATMPHDPRFVGECFVPRFRGFNQVRPFPFG